MMWKGFVFRFQNLKFLNECLSFHDTAVQSAESVQYWEAGACALAAAAALGARSQPVARQLLPLFPSNALLALGHYTTTLHYT